MRRPHVSFKSAAVCALSIGVGLSVLPVLPAVPATASEVRHAAVVSEDPVDYTPHILGGRVHAIAVVGDTVVVGGEFTRVQGARSDVERTRRNIFAFDARTGRLNPSFTPRLDGPVHALTPGPSGTVFVGGSFSHVNGVAQRGLTQLRISDGGRVPSFGDTAITSGRVNALAAEGDRLYVGGRFPGIGETRRGALARVDISSGNVDEGFAIRLTEPRRGNVSVAALALSPNGDRLVVDGNFTRVGDERRYQIALIGTSGDTARLLDWSTEMYTDECIPDFHTYMRGIDFSPDGSYFVVVTTGGSFPGTSCDTAARWETDARGTNVAPTWVNHTGGDSLYSVAVTGPAVYVGGHQRWMDNPRGDDFAGPGAKPRRGIAAIDPVTGKALSWNPGRTRGHGVEALAATPRGLFVGSDTERLGGEYHARIGMFPVGDEGQDAGQRNSSDDGNASGGRQPADDGGRGDRPSDGGQPNGRPADDGRPDDGGAQRPGTGDAARPDTQADWTDWLEQFGWGDLAVLRKP